MALADKLNAQKRELEEQQRLREQQELQVRDEALKSEISKLKTQKQILVDALEQLGGSYKEAAGLQNQKVKARQKISDVYNNPDFAPIIGDATEQEFIEQNADDEDIESWHEAGKAVKKKVGGVREAKAVIREQLPDVKFGVGVAGRESALVAVHERLAQIDVKILELFEQTSEGQQAKADEEQVKLEAQKQEIIKDYAKTWEKTSLERRLQSKLVSPREIKQGETYGIDLVKDALIGFHGQAVTQEIDKERADKKLVGVLGDLEKIEALPEEYSSVISAIDRLKARRTDVMRRIESIISSEPSYLEAINKKRGDRISGDERPGDVVKWILGHAGEIEKSVTFNKPGYIPELIGSLANQVNDSRYQSLDKVIKIVAALPDFNIGLDWVEAYTVLLDNLEAALGESPEAFAEVVYYGRKQDDYDRVFGAFQKVLFKLGRTERSDIGSTRYLKLHSDTVSYVQKEKSSIQGSVADVRRIEEQLLQRGVELREKIKTKIEVDWANQELLQFESSNRGIVDNITKAEKNALTAAQRKIEVPSLNKEISEAESRYQHIAETIKRLIPESNIPEALDLIRLYPIRGGEGYEITIFPITDSVALLDNIISALKKEIGTGNSGIARELAQKEEELRKAWFFQKSSKNSELHELKSNFEVKQARLDELMNLRKELMSMAKKLSESIAKVIDGIVLPKTLSNVNISLSVFRDNLEAELEKMSSWQPSAEEQETMTRYKSLQRAAQGN